MGVGASDCLAIEGLACKRSFCVTAYDTRLLCIEVEKQVHIAILVNVFDMPASMRLGSPVWAKLNSARID